MTDLKAIEEKMAKMKISFKDNLPKACTILEEQNIVHTLSEAMKKTSDDTHLIHHKPTTQVREK